MQRAGTRAAQRILRLCASASAGACLLTTSVSAQELAAGGVEDVSQLDLGDLLGTEVTGASRYEQSALDIAAPTVVITAAQIRARGYRDLKDIFLDLPGFDVSSNVQGEVRTLVIARGVLGNQKLLILQDGRRLNAITGERFVHGNNVPVHHAERIEVIYGPAAAVYGPDAYAGVVNIITRDGSDIDGVEVDASGGLLSLDAGSWVTDDHLVIGGALGDDSEGMVSLRLYHTPRGPDLVDDYEELRPIALYGDRFAHAEPILDVDLYSRVRLGALTLGLHYNDATETNAPSTIPDQYLYVEDNVWHQRMARAFLEHAYERDDAAFSARTTLRYQRYEVAPDANFFIVQSFTESPTETTWSGAPIKLPTAGLAEYKYALSESVRLEEQAVWRPLSWLIVSAGGLVERVLSFPKTRNLPGGPFDPDHLVVDMSDFADPTTGVVLGVTDDRAWGVRPFTNAGVNAQVELVDEARLRVSLGTRYDYSSLYGSTINPRLGVIYRPIAPLTLRAQAGTAYIQPSNYYVWENWANPFAMHIPNTDLDPERLLSVNLGGSWRLLDALNVSLDLFYNRMTDIIRPVPYGQPVFNPFQSPQISESFIEINANQGVQYTYGGELKVDWLLSLGHLYGSYAYLDGEDEETGLTINKISHHKVLVGADLEPFEGWSISPRLRWFSPVTMAASNDLYLQRQAEAQASGADPDDVSNTFGPAYGTFLLNLATHYELFDGLGVHVILRNVLNQAHHTASPYGESIWILPRAPQLRFNFLAGLRYRYAFE